MQVDKLKKTTPLFTKNCSENHQKQRTNPSKQTRQRVQPPGMPQWALSGPSHHTFRPRFHAGGSFSGLCYTRNRSLLSVQEVRWTGRISLISKNTISDSANGGLTSPWFSFSNPFYEKPIKPLRRQLSWGSCLTRNWAHRSPGEQWG